MKKSTRPIIWRLHVGIPTMPQPSVDGSQESKTGCALSVISIRVTLDVSEIMYVEEGGLRLPLSRPVTQQFKKIFGLLHVSWRRHMLAFTLCSGWWVGIWRQNGPRVANSKKQIIIIIFKKRVL